jgi:hypothetical protein
LGDRSLDGVASGEPGRGTRQENMVWVDWCVCVCGSGRAHAGSRRGRVWGPGAKGRVRGIESDGARGFFYTQLCPRSSSLPPSLSLTRCTRRGRRRGHPPGCAPGFRLR